MSTPGTSRDLSQQLERALRRAKIRKSQSHIGAHHADQRDSVNVVPLGDHLRADQQIEFTFIERIQRALEIFAAAHRVAVQASDARLGKHAVQQLFQFFRTGAEKIYILAAAVDAGFRHRRGVAAIVAFHAARALVMGHGDGAVLALQRLAASPAQHHGRISPAIQQNHDLLFFSSRSWISSASLREITCSLPVS